MSAALAVQHPPGRNPQQPQSAGHNECGLPSECSGQEWHGDRGHYCPERNAAVEEAGCERPLTGWEPLGDHFDRSRKIGSLADAERKSRDPEAKWCAGHGVTHGSHRPEESGNCKIELCANAIEDPSRDHHCGRIRHLEGNHNATVVELGPANVF
jgi:hypothetical protein